MLVLAHLLAGIVIGIVLALLSRCALQTLDAMWNQPANWFWPLLGLSRAAPSRTNSRGRYQPSSAARPSGWPESSSCSFFFILWFIPGFMQKFITGPIEQGAERHSVSMALFLTALVVLTTTVIHYYWW